MIKQKNCIKLEKIAVNSEKQYTTVKQHFQK